MYNLAVLQMKGLVRERTDSTKLLIQAAKLNHTKVREHVLQICLYRKFLRYTTIVYPSQKPTKVVTKQARAHYLLMNLSTSLGRLQALSSWVPLEVEYQRKSISQSTSILKQICSSAM